MLTHRTRGQKVLAQHWKGREHDEHETNANTDETIEFLNDLTNKVGEGKYITLLAEKQEWFNAKRTLVQERLHGCNEGYVIVDNNGNIFTFDDNSWHVEHMS